MNNTLDANQIQDRLDKALMFKDEKDLIDFEAEKIHLDIIGELKHFMESKNLSKSDIAKALNTSKSYVTQLFAGDKLLNLKTIGKLQRKFGFKFKSMIDFHGSSLFDKEIDEYNKANYPNVMKMYKEVSPNNVEDLEKKISYPNNRIKDKDYLDVMNIKINEYLNSIFMKVNLENDKNIAV